MVGAAGLPSLGKGTSGQEWLVLQLTVFVKGHVLAGEVGAGSLLCLSRGMY